VALIDSSKFGRDSLLTIFAAQDPDLIVVDEGLPADAAAAYLAAGVNLVVAEMSMSSAG
jgi:DeoR/GlpR family transcriptional regulator of sugar metabolism